MVYCTYDLWASLTEHPYKRFVFQTILLAAEFTYCSAGTLQAMELFIGSIFPFFFRASQCLG